MPRLSTRYWSTCSQMTAALTLYLDMYHSYLGLAALSVLGESSIKPIDPVYCVSTDVVESIAASILAVDSASCTGYIKNGLLWPSILKC